MSIVKDLLLIFFALSTVFVFLISNINLNRHKRKIYEILNHNIKVAELAQLRGLELLKNNYSSDLADEIRRSCIYNMTMLEDLCGIYNNEKSYKNNVNLSDLFINVSETLSEPADDKGITFYYKIDGNELICTDGYYLEKILHILTEKMLRVSREKIAYYARVLYGRTEFTIFYISPQNIKQDFNTKTKFSSVGDSIKTELCIKMISSMKGRLKFGNVKDNLQYVTFCIQSQFCGSNYKDAFKTSVQPNRCGNY